MSATNAPQTPMKRTLRSQDRHLHDSSPVTGAGVAPLSGNRQVGLLLFPAHAYSILG